MADSLQQWAERVTAQVEADEVLIVNTASKVGGWILWRDIVSFGAMFLEGIWDNLITLFDNKAKERALQDSNYYRELALYYQQGSVLVFLGNQFGYSTIDTSKQIVSACQVFEKTLSGQVGVRLHAATLEADNSITRLTAIELADFTTYIEDMKPCGRRITVLDAAIGNVILDMDVYYDPLILNADGSKFADPSSFPVLDAIYDYQNNYINNVAKFSIAELLRRLSTVEGIDDVLFIKHRHDVAGGTTYVDSTAYELEIVGLYEYHKAGTSELTFISI